MRARGEGLVPLGREGMEALYREHAVSVGRWVRALACGREMVEDLVQEVFVVALTRWSTYDQRLPFGAWLHGVAVNVVRNHRRKEGRRRRLQARFDRAELPTEAGVDAELQGRRMAHSVWAAVDRLADPLRESFVLRVIERRSLEECAEILSVSIQTVSRRATRAERLVRRAVEEDRG